MNSDEHYSEQNEAAIKGWHEPSQHVMLSFPISSFRDGTPCAEAGYKIQDRILELRRLHRGPRPPQHEYVLRLNGPTSGRQLLDTVLSLAHHTAVDAAEAYRRMMTC